MVGVIGMQNALLELLKQADLRYIANAMLAMLELASSVLSRTPVQTPVHAHTCTRAVEARDQINSSVVAKKVTLLPTQMDSIPAFTVLLAILARVT